MTRSPAPILSAVIEIVTPHQDTDHILLTPLNLTPTEKWIFSFRAFSIEFAFRIMENFISFMNTWFRAKKYQHLHYTNRFYDTLPRANSFRCHWNRCSPPGMPSVFLKSPQTDKWGFFFPRNLDRIDFRIMENFISFKNTSFPPQRYQHLDYTNRFYDALPRANSILL